MEKEIPELRNALEKARAALELISVRWDQSGYIAREALTPTR